jgi:hypothetical protein
MTVVIADTSPINYLVSPRHIGNDSIPTMRATGMLPGNISK